MPMMALGLMFTALGVASLARPVQVNEVHAAMVRVVDTQRRGPSVRATKFLGGFFVIFGTLFVVLGAIEQ